MTGTDLPALDTHAHVAPDVTRDQIAALGNAVVFAVTRSLQEASEVKERTDGSLVWGIGVHPGVSTSRAAWDPERFRDLLGSFALVSEIGLDRRGGDWARQLSIFQDILSIVRGEPVLVSIHSSGAPTEVVQHLRDAKTRGAILHWFNGDEGDVQRAIEIDSYFSINAAMSEEQIRRLPRDRILCETDFPQRKTHARRPADMDAVEKLLCRVWGASLHDVRASIWWNLRRLCEESGAIERLPGQVADTLLYL